MIRVLLAEDQALVRDGLRLLLELQGGFQVTAVENGREAVEAARRQPPDVAVIDVRMPVLDGIGCVQALRRDHPRLPILMLTTYDDDRLVRECLAAGADAYLLKDIEPEDLANAIRLLAAGGGLIPGDLAQRLLEGDGSSTGGPPMTGSGAQPGALPVEEPASPGPGAPGLEPLTPRQREVLALLARGLSNREIARQLYLSEGTVKNVVSEIYARLNVRDRVQAVLKARGLLGDSP
ncbi:MAG TPA: response regulator transcription factor [Thermaerobacter sp.]